MGLFLIIELSEDENKYFFVLPSDDENRLISESKANTHT